jgi:hypothetical protein
MINILITLKAIASNIKNLFIFLIRLVIYLSYLKFVPTKQDINEKKGRRTPT